MLHSHCTAPQKSRPAFFHDYAQAGLGTEVLPIITPDAVINPASPTSEMLREKRGKVPGRKTPDGWFGFAGWTKHIASLDDHKRWHEWGAGIGLQGRHYPAVDIDVDQPELADAVHQLATAVLGDAPCRFGNGARRVLVYRGSGLPKRRIEFRVAGARPDRPPIGAVELLGAGQQYVVEGTHPKTRLPYHWMDGRSPAIVGVDALPQVDVDLLDDFEVRLGELLARSGYEVSSRTSRSGGAARTGVWQDGLLAPTIGSIQRALAALPNEVDYDTWIMLGVATRASAGPERESEAFELFMDWSLQWPENTPEAVDAKWQSFRPPYRVGWPTLAYFAENNGDGTFFAAYEDFEPLEPAPALGQEKNGPLVSDKVEAMFARYVWVQRLKRVCDLATGELLDREQFNFENSHIGDPASSKECAYAVLARDGSRRQTVKSVTYRPGAGLFIEENLPGLIGRCVNLWRNPAPHLPVTATDADVKEWLDHMAFVIPDERERSIVLDWLAWIIQNPGEKPNWAVLVGSTYEGMGKDMMLEPVRVALGAANVREIGPGDLTSSWTWWAERARFVIVEEMHSFERKETMNRIKPLIAAPPYTLTINKKMEPQYEVPNILAAMFFTNMDNALAVSKQDRRFFITWNDGLPRSASYYTGLAAWYDAGGRERAARWLQLRDVGGFEPKGRAPETDAKGAMAKAARPMLDELVEDDLRDAEGVFRHRLVALEEVVNYVHSRLDDRRIGAQRIAGVLRKHDCISIGRLSLGEPPTGCCASVGQQRRESTVFARRGDGLFGAPLTEIREAYWAERRVLADAIEPFGAVVTQ